jgi:cell division protein FtsQ
MPKPPRPAAPAERSDCPPDRWPPRGAWTLFDRVGRFLATISALCAVASLPNSSAFTLTSVSILGSAAVSSADVLNRIGVREGDSAFRVNAWAIRRRLLKDPRIADASVALSFPRALTVSLRERDPIAALAIPEGYVEIGADGVAISRTAGPPRGLPLEVTPLALPWLQLGTAVPSADVRFGVAAAARLPPALRGEVAALRVAAGELMLETHDGTWIKAGGPGGLAERLAVAPDVLAAVRARGIRAHYVDLRVPGNVVVMPVAPPGENPADASHGSSPDGAPTPHGQENPAHR